MYVHISSNEKENVKAWWNVYSIMYNVLILVLFTLCISIKYNNVTHVFAITYEYLRTYVRRFRSAMEALAASTVSNQP